MTSFNLTVEGKATAQVVADRASVKVDISATAKTQEAARDCLKQKTFDFECDFLPRPGKGPKKAAKKGGKKSTKDSSGVSGFVVVQEDSDEDGVSDETLPKAPMMPMPPHHQYGVNCDDLFMPYGPPPPQQYAPHADLDALLQMCGPDPAAGVEIWRKGEISVLNTSHYKTTPAQRKAKKLKKPDNQLYTAPHFVPASNVYVPPMPSAPVDPLAALSLNDEDWLQQYTAKVTYTITYLDANKIPASFSSLNCKISNPILRLKPETKAAVRASLREKAAANALSQVKDYCNGLACNATTTRIAPIEFGTVASIRREHRMSRLRARSRSPVSRRRRNYSYSPSRTESDYSSDEDVSDFEERDGRGQAKNMVELEHRVEVTFKIETDEMTLKDISSK